MFVYNAECPVEDLGNGVSRKILAHSGTMMQVQVMFEVGAVGAMHSHPHEQTTYILSGEFDFTIDGVTKTVGAGDSLYKKPHVVHGCVCRKKGMMIDTFTPQREDFLAKS